MNYDITIRIGGKAGQGMNVISSLLGKVFVRNGLWTFINHDIMSRIRGGHNFSQIRLSDEPVRTFSSEVDILVCLDKDTLSIYEDEIGGITIYDSGQIKESPPAGKNYLAIPLEEIARSTGENPKMANTVASGAVLALLGLSLDTFFDLLNQTFATKGDGAIKSNRDCAQAGYDYVKQNHKDRVSYKINASSNRTKRMLITGSQAIALGALASNIRFYSAYPMSPSTPVMEYLSSKQKEYGLIVEQAEDEISAINMALGASFCGVRSMTGTSGGGLALMVEGISLAGMTETPVVILDAQRPAPATGLPTRTEQGDLLFVSHAGHGEFPRVILVPSTAEEAFYLTGRAFYLSEKYQTPVFILSDQYLNDSAWTVEKLDLDNSETYRHGIVSVDDLEKIPPYQYRRYEITDSGVSPRILPGTHRQVLYADSDEHTHQGHITESSDVRRKMVDKRLKKFSGLYEDISLPKIYPNAETELYIVSWGSTFGTVEETTDVLRRKDINVGYIHFSEIYPLRKDAIPEKILKNSKFVGVENNATGQFTKLLRMETGVDINDKILKYDGQPFSPEDLFDKVEKFLR